MTYSLFMNSCADALYVRHLIFIVDLWLNNIVLLRNYGVNTSLRASKYNVGGDNMPYMGKRHQFDTKQGDNLFHTVVM